jgi:hypothetical protein
MVSNFPKPRALVQLAALSALLSLSACAPPLLAPDEPRSQYDRYDTVRNQHDEQYIFNEFGRRRPNLERRLSPKE